MSALELPLNAIPITLPDDTQQITDISGTFRAIFNSEDKDISMFKNMKIIIGIQNTKLNSRLEKWKNSIKTLNIIKHILIQYL